MIIRITWLNSEKKSIIMLYGNSYKTWSQQVQEYIWENIKWWDSTSLIKRNLFGILKVEVSDSKWISWGGLKWCPHKNFQKELNREGCQLSDPDANSPRHYRDFLFRPDKKVHEMVTKMYLSSLRNLNKENP